MQETEITAIESRYLNTGFLALQATLNSNYMKEVQDNKISVTFFSTAGKTSFELDMAKQVNPITFNLESYTVRHQPNIIIEELQIGTINTTQLEARIIALNYISDPSSPDAIAYKKAIQMDLDILSRETKASYISAYHAFVAKYFNGFEFGDIAAVISIRKEKLQDLFREKVYSFLGSDAILPPQAYEEITSNTFKKRKKSVPQV